MREILSPLSGIRSPFGQLTSPLAFYAVLGIKPQLVFDFDDEKYFTGGTSSTFDSSITHSAASNATMVGSDGLLKWRPHNLLTYSGAISGLWSAVRDVTISTTDTAIAPDGVSIAQSIIPNNTAGGTFDPIIARTITALSLNKYTFSFWAKTSSGSSYIGTPIGMTFATSSTGGEFYGNSLPTVLSEDWQFFTREVDINLSGIDTLRVDIADGASAPDGSSVYIWGFHLYRSDLGGMVNNPDQTTGFETYVPTTSSAVYLPRRGHHVYNGDSWVNKGLLHESEARTNVVTYSEAFDNAAWSKTSIATPTQSEVGPAGAGTAWRVVDSNTGGSGTSFLSQAVTVDTSSVYTFSVYCKADQLSWVYLSQSSFGVTGGGASFDLTTGSLGTVQSGITNGATITDAGNGFYRCSISFTTDSVDTSGAISIYIADGDLDITIDRDGTSSIIIYGAQFEKAPTPSSYIPTSGATVTRAAETLTVPAANLPWPSPVVIGEELVTDGGFDVGTVPAGWSAYTAPAASSTLSIVNNTLRVTKTGTSAGFAQYYVTGMSVGKVYQFQADFLDAVSALFGGSTSSTDTSPEFGETSYSVNQGTRSFVWRATTTAAYLIVATTAASVDVDNISVKEINPLSVSIQMQGEMTYADEDTLNDGAFYSWSAGAAGYIQAGYDDRFSTTMTVRFRQANAGTLDLVQKSNTYSPDVNVPFNIASRHGSTFINGAVDGVALTADTTPTALPNLSATDLDLGYDFNGTISLFRIWADDLGDTGIAGASAPSTVPSLSLTFDGQSTSFTDGGLVV